MRSRLNARAITDYFPRSSPQVNSSQPPQSSSPTSSKQSATRSSPAPSDTRSVIEISSDSTSVIEISSDSSLNTRNMVAVTRAMANGQPQRAKPAADLATVTVNNKSRKRTQSNASSQFSAAQTAKRPNTTSRKRPMTPIPISSDDESDEVIVIRKQVPKNLTAKRNSLVKPSVKLEAEPSLTSIFVKTSPKANAASPAPSSKRSAASLGSPLPSPKRPRISLDSNTQRIPPTTAEVIPSSEGEEEADLLPMDRSFTQTKKSNSSPKLGSNSPTKATSRQGPNTPPIALHRRDGSPTPSEIETSLLLEQASGSNSKRPSLSHSQTTIQASAEPITPSRQTTIAESSSAVVSSSSLCRGADTGDDPSDAESLDSVKKAERILAQVNMIQDDDEDDLPDSNGLLTAEQAPNKGKGKAVEKALSSHISRAHNSLVTSSPLTSPNKPPRSRNVDRGSPATQVFSGVFLPSRPQSQKPKPKVEIQPLPRPAVEVQSSSKNFQSNVIAGLLKDKKVSEKRYPLAHVTGTNAEENDGGAPSSTQLDSATEPSNPVLIEASEKVSNIIQNDMRDDERKAQVNDNYWSSEFWEQSLQTRGLEERNALSFPDIDAGMGHLSIFKKAARSQSHALLSSLLHAGILNGLSDIPDAVFDWLLDLAVLHPTSIIGNASVMCIKNLFASKNTSAKEIQLDYSTVRRLLVGLGAKQDRLHLLPPGDNPDGEPEWFSRRERDERAFRLLEVVEGFAKVNQIHIPDIPNIVLALLLVSLDPNTRGSRIMITQTLRTILGCFKRASRKRQYQYELETCRCVIKATENFCAKDRLALLKTVPRGSDDCATRISRWIALGMLGDGERINSMKEDEYINLPPLSRIVSIIFAGEFGTASNSAYVLFVASDDMKYKDLLYNTDILGIALTGLDVTPEEQAKNRCDPMMEMIRRELLALHGKILDDKGIGMEQTHAKDAVLKLSKRLDYQTKKPGTGFNFDELANNSSSILQPRPGGRIQTKLTFESKKKAPE